MGRHQVFRHRPVDRAVGLDPDRDAAPGRVLRSAAARRRAAEPAGPSVWCTMMLRQGWAFATSPQGASQTIFRPGMSGVPERARERREVGRLRGMREQRECDGEKRHRQQAEFHGRPVIRLAACTVRARFCASSPAAELPAAAGRVDSGASGGAGS